jgi:hypothetical protein
MGSQAVSSPDPGGVIPIFTGSVPVSFGGKAVKSSVNVSGLSKGSTIGDVTEPNGIVTCTGVNCTYLVTTEEWVGTGFYRYSFYKPNIQSGTVTWTEYSAPPPPPPPPVESPIADILETSEGDIIAEEIDNPDDEEKETQWFSRQVILAEGINEERIDTYHRDDLRNGSVCSPDIFVSPYMDNVEQARNLGDHFIYDSTKNLSISASVPPIFTAKLGDWCEVIDTHNFIDEIERIQAIELKGAEPSPEVNWYFEIREDEE